MGKTILLLGTRDTEGVEFGYVKERIEEIGSLQKEPQIYWTK
jgi:hypothetical protein